MIYWYSKRKEIACLLLKKIHKNGMTLKYGIALI
jgi:hypothetical protein